MRGSPWLAYSLSMHNQLQLPSLEARGRLSGRMLSRHATAGKMAAVKYGLKISCMQATVTLAGLLSVYIYT